MQIFKLGLEQCAKLQHGSASPYPLDLYQSPSAKLSFSLSLTLVITSSVSQLEYSRFIGKIRPSSKLRQAIIEFNFISVKALEWTKMQAALYSFPNLVIRLLESALTRIWVPCSNVILSCHLYLTLAIISLTWFRAGMCSSRPLRIKKKLTQLDRQNEL